MIIPNEIVFDEVRNRILRGEDVTIPFKGRSMEPLLRDGCKITLSPVCKIRRGDVVLFRFHNQYLLHRVLFCCGNRVVLKGDSSRNIERVECKDIVARMVEVNPKRKDILSCMMKLSPIYFLCLFILMWAPMGGVPLDNFVFGIRMDHLVHASVYIPASWFISRNRPYLWAMLVAVVTESGQYLLPYRSFDVNDLIANLLGVILGWTIYYFYRRRLLQKSHKD